MSEYWDNRNKVVRFIKDSGMSAYDVARISAKTCVVAVPVSILYSTTPKMVVR